MELVLEDDKEPRKIPWKIISALAVILFIAVGAAFAYNYAYVQHPEVYKKIKIKLDKLGLIQQSPEEIQRVAEINKMTISYEEKQILINKTIFMGATPRMVMLALGQPKQGHKGDKTNEGKDIITLTYHMPGEFKPTQLYFENNKLTKAYKISNIDIDRTSAPYTGTNSE